MACLFGHRFAEVRRSFTPSRLSGCVELSGVTTKDAKELTLGVTTIELHCKKCGVLKIVTTPGQLTRSA